QCAHVIPVTRYSLVGMPLLLDTPPQVLTPPLCLPGGSGYCRRCDPPLPSLGTERDYAAG
ncbi:hypothetical protein, partial [Mycobacterium sp.]|uniref:hypothetical protein n=1 Tax=Mycobacterium sp. TaxID=1785 RepID=UPI0026071C2C